MTIVHEVRLPERAGRLLPAGLAAGLVLLAGWSGAPSSVRPATPTVAYTLAIDSARPGSVDVAIRVRGAPPAFRLAMAVHPEYDDRYWRFLDSLRVEGTRGESAGTVTRADSTLWRVTLPGGDGTIRYRVRLPAPTPGTFQGSWRPFVAATGALVNGPDFFLYLPDFADAPVTLDLRIPRSWRSATGLRPLPGSNRFAATGAAELLDAPLLLGRLHEWRFRTAGVPYLVAYWPTPGAVPFDTTAFVGDLRRIVGASVGVFQATPFRRYVFLLRDGTGGALEHHNSVTIGIASAQLARDPRALLGEMAHEFFHSWNLVALRPAGYGELSYLRPRRTAGLWWGEGVTMYYADVLRRRAGLLPAAASRLDHLREILQQYYTYPANLRVPPEQASLAFGDSPAENPAAAANYYVQGELIGFALDGLLRDSTHGRRDLDDLMRALYRGRPPSGEFTDQELAARVNAICGCRFDDFFAAHVAGSAPVDAAAIVAPLGYQVVVDTVPAADAQGRPLPDRRVWATQRAGAGPLRLILLDPASAWARAGLRTGDTLVTVNGGALATVSDFQRALQAMEVGDSMVVEVAGGGSRSRVVVRAPGYARPRVRLLPAPDATPARRLRLESWLQGR